jgi:Arc/MetJ-type ribon-helix-helix transcriptional regulator
MYGMSNRFETPDQTKVTIRCSQELVDAYDDTLEDTSRSEAIRQHMRETAGKADEDNLPENQLLRDGLTAIQRATDPDGRVPTSVAKSRVSEATRVKTSDAIRTVISPLDERGYLSVVTYGTLRVDPVDQANGQNSVQ